MPAAVVFALLALASALIAQTPAQTLRVVRAVVSQSEDGPAIGNGGNGANGLAFQPGDLAFFSFQVENYKTGTTGKVQLTGHIEAFDPKGKPIVPRDEEVIGTTVSQEDKDWKPKLRLPIQIPSIAPPGDYRVKFEVTDQQTRQTASGELAFAVGGKGVEPANAL